METRTEMEIDIIGLLLHLKTKIWIIVAMALVFGIGGYVGSKMLSTPVYTASTQVYISTEKGLNSSDITVATQLRKDCAMIIRGESVTRVVIENLGLNMNAKSLGSSIVVDSEDNTRVLVLSYTSTDPQLAAQIINAVRDEAAIQIKALLGRDVMKTIHEAEIPRAVSTMNIKRNSLAAAAIGAVLTIAILVVVFLLDDTIRSEDDVENHLGLSTLGVIPSSKELYVNRGGKKSKQRKFSGRR